MAVAVAAGGGMREKFAVTVVFPFIVTDPAVVLPLAPLQLLNAYPLCGLAVRLTLVPCLYCAPQFAAVFTVTLPVPLGFTLVVRVKHGTKFAVTFVVPDITKDARFVLPLTPVQLLNAKPLFGVAVKSMVVPDAYCVPLLQFGPGLGLTLPLPLGLTLVVSV